MPDSLHLSPRLEVTAEDANLHAIALDGRDVAADDGADFERGGPLVDDLVGDSAGRWRGDCQGSTLRRRGRTPAGGILVQLSDRPHRRVDCRWRAPASRRPLSPPGAGEPPIERFPAPPECIA